eukprot:m.88361 g.88361  ORF g.88361 m.88361 type:complete len:676 (-) comp18065_c0_seq1:202-2229(-)
MAAVLEGAAKLVCVDGQAQLKIVVRGGGGGARRIALHTGAVGRGQAREARAVGRGGGLGLAGAHVRIAVALAVAAGRVAGGVRGAVAAVELVLVIVKNLHRGVLLKEVAAHVEPGLRRVVGGQAIVLREVDLGRVVAIVLVERRVDLAGIVGVQAVVVVGGNVVAEAKGAVLGVVGPHGVVELVGLALHENAVAQVVDSRPRRAGAARGRHLQLVGQALAVRGGLHPAGGGQVVGVAVGRGNAAGHAVGPVEEQARGQNVAAALVDAGQKVGAQGAVVAGVRDAPVIVDAVAARAGRAAVRRVELHHVHGLERGGAGGGNAGGALGMRVGHPRVVRHVAGVAHGVQNGGGNGLGVEHVAVGRARQADSLAEAGSVGLFALSQLSGDQVLQLGKLRQNLLAQKGHHGRVGVCVEAVAQRLRVGNEARIVVAARHHVMVPRVGNPAVVATQHVLAVGLVPLAALRVVGQNLHINPGSGMPVRVVVTLLGALIPTASTVVVLASEARRVAVEVTIGREETAVAVAVAAVGVVVVILVHAIAHIVVAVAVLALGGLARNGAGGSAIAQCVRAHVLEDDFAVVVVTAARVLVGPFNWQSFAFVKVERSDVVATAVVVLRVKQTVGVVAVAVGLVQTVVGAAHVLHVHVSGSTAQQGDQHKSGGTLHDGSCGFFLRFFGGG